MNETDVIASRRGFLTRMAYGSLLVMSGSGIAEAAVKHATTHNKKPDAKKTTSTTSHSKSKSSLHDDTKNAKDSLRKRLDLKTAHIHDKHATHKEIALNGKHDHRIHSSLSKDHGSHGHRLHNDVNNRLALRSNNHPALEMPEFDLQREELATRFHSDDVRNRFSIQSAAPRFGSGNVLHKTLALQNNTTGDSLNVTYFEKGRYIPDALHEINYLYRDHLTDEVHPVDTALLDQLHDLQSTLGTKKSIHVICGYRSPFTNAHLRRNSRGVARNSLHMQGRAIDIRIAGVDSRTIRDAALSMARGGVGYYPGSNFVHLDTGDVRTW